MAELDPRLVAMMRNPGSVVHTPQTMQHLAADLREVCATMGFGIVYQPQVDLRTERVTNFEALIRWHHPDRGDVSPEDFIPLAEQIGLIGKIGQWVLERACRDAMTWPEEVGLAVNVSALQLADPTLPWVTPHWAICSISRFPKSRSTARSPTSFRRTTISMRRPTRSCA